MTSANKKNALVAAWEKTLARRGGDTAIYSTKREPLRSFDDIEREADELSQTLAMFHAGDVVAIQIGNSPQWPAILLSCMRRGLIPFPLGRHIEKAERETALTTCGAAGIIEAAPGAPISFRQIQKLPISCQIVGNPKTDFLKPASASRAIRFRAEQLVADCDNICKTMCITGADLNFGVIPFSHSYGFGNLLAPLLCRGVPFVAGEDRMPRAILNGLARTGATVFPGMPIFYQTFGDMRNLPELPRLRLCISAGAPLSREVGMRFTKKFGVKIHTFYGASECGGISYDASDKPDYENEFAGQPLKNVGIEFLAESRIRVVSAAVGDGYFPTPDPATLADGRFIPTDLVEKRTRGLFLIGNVSDVINIAGRKLNPAEVEAQLMRFPCVKQVVVFGVPSVLRNEEAVACVVGNGGMKVAALLPFAQTVLSAWQVPKDIWLVNEIPTDDDGKINRRELARCYLNEKRRVIPNEVRNLPNNAEDLRDSSLRSE